MYHYLWRWCTIELWIRAMMYNFTCCRGRWCEECWGAGACTREYASPNQKDSICILTNLAYSRFKLKLTGNARGFLYNFTRLSKQTDENKVFIDEYKPFCQETTISKDKRFLYLDVKDAVGVNLDAGCLLEELCQLVLVVLLNLHHFSKELLYRELRITSTDYFVRRSVRPSSPIVPWSTLCSALSKRF